jgi:Right handed beta helix region
MVTRSPRTRDRQRTIGQVGRLYAAWTQCIHEPDPLQRRRPPTGSYPFVSPGFRAWNRPGGLAQELVNRIHGSRATLSNNDIQGFTHGVRVDSGIEVDEPGWAPSQARLEGNRVHGNEGVGLWVAGRGSRVIGSGNTYEGSALSGVHVTGGATYVGERERLAGNTWDGLVVRGCDERNRRNADGSVSPVILQERSLAVLNDFALDGNGADGLWAACDAQVNLTHGSVSQNVGRGAGVASTWDFGDGNQSYAPSRLSAAWTVFDTNRHGAVAFEDSHLVLGTLDEPGMNSFLGNRANAIRNLSTQIVFAQWNWFGTTDAAVIAGSLVGDVTYEPFLLHEP